MRAFAFLLPLVLALAGCAQPADTPGAPGTTPATSDGQATMGPTWSFAAIDGQTYTRDDPPANATVLFFMATWCGSCRAKAPVVANVVEDYANESVRVFSVDFDPSETADDLRAWQETYGQPWPHGIDKGQTLQRTFGVTSQSSVVVLDARGNVAQQWGYGRVSEDALRTVLDQLVGA